jgi:hypothetical protein
MGRLTSILPAFAIAATLAAPTRAAIAAPSAPTPRASLTAVQQRYLALARAGVARAEQRWRDRRAGWYDARLGDHERYPLATIWDIVPLFEAVDAIAIAQPTAADIQAVRRFAADNARDAQTRALNGEGLYLLSWSGGTLPVQDALPGMLQTQAATTSLFAWLAVYPPP